MQIFPLFLAYHNDPFSTMPKSLVCNWNQVCITTDVNTCTFLVCWCISSVIAGPWEKQTYNSANSQGSGESAHPVHVQSRQSHRCSHTQCMEMEDTSDNQPFSGCACAFSDASDSNGPSSHKTAQIILFPIVSLPGIPKWGRDWLGGILVSFLMVFFHYPIKREIWSVNKMCYIFLHITSNYCDVINTSRPQ